MVGYGMTCVVTTHTIIYIYIDVNKVYIIYILSTIYIIYLF